MGVPSTEEAANTVFGTLVGSLTTAEMKALNRAIFVSWKRYQTSDGFSLQVARFGRNFCWQLDAQPATMDR